METVRILGIPGSIRKNSYNKMLLRAASSLLPYGATLEIYENLHLIPPFNQDEENNPPEPVRELKRKIKEADAILFATPEYNYSVPGVLKNAIDWASRPYGDNSFDGKPAAVMSASIGMLGGSRAQYHLRQMFVFLNIYPVNLPEVFVTFASQKFDSQGNLIDQDAKKFISQLLVNLVDWARFLKQKKVAKLTSSLP
ncbi:NAD(P)H-dependent FMN reductase [Sulfodiicoccus acidiphilus]|uniref:NAD(P)H-dependent FMN reductase n=1 Tax=Sulfodiicoccus acidiphilus TaxID=1670455 RepID=A0A348B3F8_9CREN|nr:NAD(P)H-dependent oxidoreductase [Sulfodiicoccus acidiphilus]BBD72710.1 NAD(P)H-dependent FMN reductase [Sulfodiicoccus acidiphilus]GGT95364.1 NAD(P)H-dependent FMN reductase [Sulfodiicoccus acidiphilus]